MRKILLSMALVGSLFGDGLRIESYSNDSNSLLINVDENITECYNSNENPKCYFHVFIDTDNNSSTGFYGSDYRITGSTGEIYAVEHTSNNWSDNTPANDLLNIGENMTRVVDNQIYLEFSAIGNPILNNGNYNFTVLIHKDINNELHEEDEKEGTLNQDGEQISFANNNANNDPIGIISDIVVAGNTIETSGNFKDIAYYEILIDTDNDSTNGYKGKGADYIIAGGSIAQYNEDYDENNNQSDKWIGWTSIDAVKEDDKITVSVDQSLYNITVKTYDNNWNQFDEKSKSINYQNQEELGSDKKVYLLSEEIKLSYDIHPNQVRDNNWIGIYKKGKSNDWNNVVEWSFIGNATGFMTQNDNNQNINLEEGEYEARLFYNNSFDMEYSVKFSVKNISTEYKKYKSNENITIVIPNPTRSQANDNGDVGEKTWVGVFHENDATHFDNAVKWNWIAEGQKRVDIGTLPNGSYKVALFYNNSADINQSQSLFSVSADGETNGKHVLDYGVKCDGVSDDTNSLQTAFNYTSYSNWTEHTLIFPKEGECITRGIRWENVNGSENSPYTIIGNGATLKAEGGINVGNMDQKSWLLWIDNASYIKVENLDFDGNRNAREVLAEFYESSDSYLSRDINVLIPLNRKNGENLENASIFQYYYNSNLVITSVVNAEFIDVDSDYSVEDGFYIGWRDVNLQYTKYIKLNNCSSSYAFRNNLTISNCIDCNVTDGSYTNAIGVAPEAGIDVECDTGYDADIPDNEGSNIEYFYLKNNLNSECLKDIKIFNVVIKNNYGVGLSVADSFEPKNINIQYNIFDNNHISERSCDNKGMALNAGGMSGSSTIKENIFKNFINHVLNNENNDTRCRSLIDFSSPDYEDGDFNSVQVQNNIFKNIKITLSENELNKIIYIHSGNGGMHNIINNDFTQIGIGNITNNNWFTDSHENTNKESTFQAIP